MSRKFSVLFLLVIFGFIISICSTGYAGTVGNPAGLHAPDGTGIFSLKKDKKVEVKTGVDIEFLLDKDVEADAATSTTFTSGEWYMARLSYVMYDIVEPYVKFGAAHFKATWDESGSPAARLESDTNFAWAIGAKFLIWEIKKHKIQFLGDAMYRVADLEPDQAYLGGATIPNPSFDPAASRFFVQEWHLALMAAAELDITGSSREDIWGVTSIIPYAGLRYADFNGRLRITRANGSFLNPGEIENEHKFGLFAGCDFVGPNSTSVNFEGRFIDETALTAGMAIMF